jgi:hypothetical protein
MLVHLAISFGVIWFSRRESLRYPPENTQQFKTLVLKLVGQESYNGGMRKNSFGYAGKKVILIKISGGYQAMINGQLCDPGNGPTECDDRDRIDHRCRRVILSSQPVFCLGVHIHYSVGPVMMSRFEAVKPMEPVAAVVDVQQIAVTVVDRGWKR